MSSDEESSKELGNEEPAFENNQMETVEEDNTEITSDAFEESSNINQAKVVLDLDEAKLARPEDYASLSAAAAAAKYTLPEGLSAAIAAAATKYTLPEDLSAAIAAAATKYTLPEGLSATIAAAATKYTLPKDLSAAAKSIGDQHYLDIPSVNDPVKFTDKNQYSPNNYLTSNEQSEIIKDKIQIKKDKAQIKTDLAEIETQRQTLQFKDDQIARIKADLLEKQELISTQQEDLDKQKNITKDAQTAVYQSQEKIENDIIQLNAEKDRLKSLQTKIKQDRSDIENKVEIADSAKKYMQEEIDIRRKRRDNYQKLSHAWSLGAALLIILGLGLFYDQYDLLNVSYILKEGIRIPVATSIYLLLKAGFFISAFGVAVRFCMVFRDKFMTEASQESEQIDNMSYGKFYVDTYAATSTREQVTEALSGWHTKPKSVEVKEEQSEIEMPISKDMLDPKSLKIVTDLIQGLIKGDEKDKKQDDKSKEKAD